MKRLSFLATFIVSVSMLQGAADSDVERHNKAVWAVIKPELDKGNVAILESSAKLKPFLESKGISPDDWQTFSSIGRNLYFYYVAKGVERGLHPISAWIELNKEYRTEWLQRSLRGISIADLIEHDMLPVVDEKGNLSFTGLPLGSLKGLNSISGINKIRSIGIYDTLVWRIEANDFNGMDSLTSIWLGDNKRLRLVDEDAFKSLPNLKAIMGAFSDPELGSQFMQAAAKTGRNINVQ